jgi:hypothetical protein
MNFEPKDLIPYTGKIGNEALQILFTAFALIFFQNITDGKFVGQGVKDLIYGRIESFDEEEYNFETSRDILVNGIPEKVVVQANAEESMLIGSISLPDQVGVLFEELMKKHNWEETCARI